MSENINFFDLSKNSKKNNENFPKYRLALLGDCATQNLAIALKGYAYTSRLSLDLFDGGYDQILSNIIDSNSQMYSFKPDAIIIYMSVENLYNTWCETPINQRHEFAEKSFSIIKEYWSYITTNCTASILQFLFSEYDDMVFGNYACKQASSFIFQLRKINFLIMNECIINKNIYLIDLCGIQAQTGRKNIFDPKQYYIAKMTISITVLPLIAKNVINVIQSLRGIIKKCIILDLDNTLWGGIIGDDGLTGIQIGELGAGRAYSEFQKWLKELKNRGILLAVCSKNEEKNAKEPFEKHEEMILRLEDFSVFTANWDDKASNIRYIQQILNIGMDSIIFIDDNPFERDIVRSHIPEIIVPNMPEDPGEYLSYLQSLNLFESISYSNEDTNRTEQYRAEAKREVIRLQYTNYDEYLQSLEMISSANTFDVFNIPRISQLTQRSNQFNLRTIRHTESEIKSIMNNSNKITYYFTLKDKLSDYGLICVIILDKIDNECLFIENWIMSCRVLKRGMEEFVMNKIFDTANILGVKFIRGEYIRTSKNDIVSNIYKHFNFTFENDSYILNIDDYKKHKTFIKEAVYES